MRLSEAKEILNKNGFIIEGSMNLKDKITNAHKQLTYIKLKELADLLKSHKCSYEFRDNNTSYSLYLSTSFNYFRIEYVEILDCYDIYFMFAEEYKSFKTAEKLVKWLFGNGE